jgi:hypothetical protein
VEVFHKRDADYVRWLREHPGGYVLAVRTDRALTLHRAGCGSLRGGSRGHSLTSTPRVCSPDRAEIEGWAREAGRAVMPCGVCKP